MTSTFVITLVDPLPDDQDPWPWGYAPIVIACLMILWRSAYPRVVAALSVIAATVYYPWGFPDGVVTLCAVVMPYTVVRWGYRRFGWSLGLGQFTALNLWELTWGGDVRPEALRVIAWVLVVLYHGRRRGSRPRNYRYG